MGFQSVLAGAIRIILFGLNFCTLLAGGVLLGAGAYVKISIKDFVGDVQDAETINTVAYFLIGLGCVVVILSLVGCLGACLQNQHLLACYFVMMLLLLLLEIVIGILYAVKKKNIEKEIEDYVKDAINNEDPESEEMQLVYTVQGMLQCCGYDGPSDYKNYISFPDSCCEGEPVACTTSNAYQTGCKTKLDQFIDAQSVLVIIVVCAVIVLEISTMLAACYLRHRELQDIDQVISDPPYSI